MFVIKPPGRVTGLLVARAAPMHDTVVSLLASLSSSFAATRLSAALTRAAAAGFFSATLLIWAAPRMSLPARATAAAVASLCLLFFGYHLFVLWLCQLTVHGLTHLHSVKSDPLMSRNGLRASEL